MFRFFRKSVDINTTEVVDKIENAVYLHIKSYGFKKYGRTLHRFVSGDISQVIHFQSGMPIHGMKGLLCINLGVRIPECDEMSFRPMLENKKYYHEYNCTIRSRLGTVSGKNETWYDLSKNTEKIIKCIIAEIDEYVLPAYEVLNSREAILAHRRDYPLLDNLCSSDILVLHESMMYGYMGDFEKAKELFEIYYESAVAEYNDMMVNGHKQYLKKGERVVYMNQDITADRDGYVTLYGASHSHIDYLDELAIKLGLRKR